MKTIDEGALIKRINRKLEARGEKLRKTRGFQNVHDLGEYWIQDVSRNLVLGKFVEPNKIARGLGVSLKR